MAVRCPYCHHSIELRGAHPGKFTPKCPQCHHRFILVIPEDASIPPLVGEMPDNHPNLGSIIGDTAVGVTQNATQHATQPATHAAATATAPPPASATIPPPAAPVGLSGPPGD